jgi:hypothetical protein
MVELVLSGKRGGTEAGGTVGMISAGKLHWLCTVDSSKASVEDDIKEFRDECCSTLKFGLGSLATRVDWIKVSSESESLDLFSPRVGAAETLTPPLFQVLM